MKSRSLRYYENVVNSGAMLIESITVVEKMKMVIYENIKLKEFFFVVVMCGSCCFAFFVSSNELTMSIFGEMIVINLIVASFVYLFYYTICWDFYLFKKGIGFSNKLLFNKKKKYLFSEIKYCEVRRIMGGPYLIVYTELGKKLFGTISNKDLEKVVTYLKDNKLRFVESSSFWSQNN